MLLRAVDIETTGQAPPAEVIEFGRVDVRRIDSEWQVGRPVARLYRPLHGIPPETMAVHHITEMDMTPRQGARWDDRAEKSPGAVQCSARWVRPSVRSCKTLAQRSAS